MKDLENKNYFFCQACLMDKLVTEASPDLRYCQGCYEFLSKEAELIGTSRPAWVPRAPKAKISSEKSIKVSDDVLSIMSTLDDKKSEVDIIQPPVTTRTGLRRGPKHRQLPEDLIGQLADAGMGSKAIATRLVAEYGRKVSYKTIQRVLSGERKQ